MMNQKNIQHNTSKFAMIVGAGGVGRALIEQYHSVFPDKKLIVADKVKPFWQMPENVIFIQVDLFKDDLQVLFNQDIDTLIFCAGIGRLSMFETFNDTEIEKNFTVNTLSVIKIIKHYYSKLSGKESFYCAVLTSITGYVASPLYSVYSASKASLVKFIQAINAELEYKDSPNRVLDVAPGRLNTAFNGTESSKKDLDELAHIAREIVENMYERKLRFIPKEKEIYADVIKRNNENVEKFAQESIKYKMQTCVTNDKPQIKVGYLTGTFDLFHVGHLNLLRNAKKYCDKLIVGVHPDGSHKNKEVFIPLDERMEIVRSIKYVDQVMVCTDEDIDAYPALKYDYLFVGSDYEGTERFKRYEEYFAKTGVKIIYLPYTTKTSSTQLRSVLNNRMKKEGKKE